MKDRSKKEVLERSQHVCEKVATRIKEAEELPSPLEIKMMIEDELGYGLSDEEITTLAITFKHIDNLFERYEDLAENDPKMMYR